MIQSCSSCRWSVGIDCERPDAVPEVWLAEHERDGVLVDGADGCPGWVSAMRAMRELCLAAVDAEPGLTTAEVAARVGISFRKSLPANLTRWGLVSKLVNGRRPGVFGSGAFGRVLRWYPPTPA